MKPRHALTTLFFTAALLPTAHAGDGTWLNTGTTNASWKTTSNWVGGTVPGPINAAIFNTPVGTFGTAANPITTASTRVSGITFTTSAGDYVIGKSDGDAIQLGGTIQIDSKCTSGAIVTINCPISISTATIANQGNGTLKIGGNITAGASGTITFDGKGAQDNTFSGSFITPTMNVTKAGDGTWKFTGSNAHGGATTISAGFLIAVANPNNGVTADGQTTTVLSPNSAITLDTNARLQLRSDYSTTFSPKSLTGSGTIVNIDVNNVSATAATGPQNKTLTLTSATPINTTSLVVSGGNGYSLALPDINISGASATLNPSTAALTCGTLTTSSTTTGLYFAGNQSITVQGGIASGTGKLSLRFNNTSIITLRDAWTQTAGGTAQVAFNQGTLILDHSSALSSASVPLGTQFDGVPPAVTLLLGGSDPTGLTGGINCANKMTAENLQIGPLTVGGRNTSGTNTFSGIITLGITAPKPVNLVAAAGGIVDFTGPLLKAPKGTTTVVSTVNNPYTVDGATITPTGTVRLSAANTYTTTTTVKAGTLDLIGSVAAGINVSAGATLRGTGSAGGNVTVPSGAHFAATLAPTPAAQDPLTATGNITLSTGNVIDISATAVPSPGDYILATATGTLAYTPGTVNFSGVTGTLSVSGKNLILTVTPPAPGYPTWAAANGIYGQPATGDYDQDGLSNLLEYALGKNPTTSSTPAATYTANTLTFTKGTDAVTNGDITYALETSPDLITWTPVQPTTNTPTAITLTLTLPTSSQKKFARLKITRN